MKVYFQIAERSLSYSKILQASAMKVYFQIAERSLSYSKILQASAMKVYFQIAECSLSYAKIHENADKAKKSCRFFEKYIPLYAFLVKKVVLLFLT